MLFLIIYFFSVSITFYSAWLYRPQYVESFLLHLPLVNWSEIGLVLILVNYSVLFLSISFSFDKDSRSNFAIVIGGLIASSTIGSLLSVSFVFNILWAAVTPQYLLLIMIVIYAISFGLPLLIYSIKENEKNQPTHYYLNAKLISQIKQVLVEIEHFAIKNKISTSSIKKLENDLLKISNDELDLSLIAHQLQEIASSFDLPEVILANVDMLQKKIKGS